MLRHAFEHQTARSSKQARSARGLRTDLQHGSGPRPVQWCAPARNPHWVHRCLSLTVSISALTEDGLRAASEMKTIADNKPYHALRKRKHIDFGIVRAQSLAGSNGQKGSTKFYTKVEHFMAKISDMIILIDGAWTPWSMVSLHIHGSLSTGREHPGWFLCWTLARVTITVICESESGALEHNGFLFHQTFVNHRHDVSRLCGKRRVGGFFFFFGGGGNKFNVEVARGPGGPVSSRDVTSCAKRSK